MSNTIENYNKHYQNIDSEIFPQEWIVRIFMGKYPKINLQDNLKGKKILEVSCGDGRNFAPLIKKEMKISGNSQPVSHGKSTSSLLIERAAICSVR